MLREARIVMPYNSGIVSSGAHTAMATAFCEAFGGYTCTDGVGGWMNGAVRVDDVVKVYDVAIEADRDASWDRLFQIAMQAGQALNQEAVYIRYPDGSVEIAKVPAAGDTTWRERYATERDAENPSYARYGLTLATDASGNPVGVIAADTTPKVPLGGRRLPAVGEIWENAIGQKVAVVAQRRIIDDRLDVVALTAGDGASFKAGVAYEVDEDGKVLIDKSSHPRDLKRFIKDF